MNPLVALSIVVLLGWIVESLVEAVLGTPFDKIPALGPYKWLLMYVAFGVGIVGAFVYELDILALLERYLDPNALARPTTFGMILTGLAIGRGSNYIHDMMKNLKIASDTAAGAAPAGLAPADPQKLLKQLELISKAEDPSTGPAPAAEETARERGSWEPF